MSDAGAPCLLTEAVLAASARSFPEATPIVMESTDSTQDVIARLVDRGAPPGTWCVALEQTSGRGRADRQWFAPKGSSLLISITFTIPSQVLEGLPFSAALAVADAITAISGVATQVKWPNDVLWDGRKLAGILPDVTSLGERARIILGMGINCTTSAFPADVPGVSCAAFMPHPPSLDQLLAHLLPALSSNLSSLIMLGPAATISRWKQSAIGLGSPVHVTHTVQPEISGIAIDVDDHGALIISTATGDVHVLAGDVHLGLPLPRSSCE